MNLKLVQSSLTRRIVVPVIAAGALIAGGAWSLARPANAAAPAAAPLDESSVGPLLSLDQAMETLAARVTPAVVNVTVTAKVKQQRISQFNGNGQGDDDNQGQD
jgi:serine protease Do